MKNTFKKLFSLLIVAAMCASLSGAALADNEIAGLYTMEYDMTELAVEMFDQGTGMGEALSIGDYLDEMKLKVNFEFREDQTYTMSLDTESFNEALGNFRDAAIPFVDEMVFIILVAAMAEEGVVIESREEVESVLGIPYESVDEIILEASIEELVDELIAESFPLEEIEESFFIEGRYLAEDGKLYTSGSFDEEPETAGYELYELDGENLTILEGVNVDESQSFVYPMELVRVSQEEAAA